jgi:hypothetical protein
MRRGFAAVVALTAAATTVFGALGLWVIGRMIDEPQTWPGIFGFLIAFDAGLVALVALFVLRSRGNGSLVEGYRQACTEATAIGAAFIGAAIALPLLALHGSYVPDTDSQRILASVNFVRRIGPGYLLRNQDALLPQLLFRPTLMFGGLSAARIVPILGTIFLASVVAALAFALTHRVFGAVVAAIVIVCMKTIMYSAVELPLYELTLAFGYLGGWSAYKALRAESRRSCARWAILAAVTITLAVESQGTGQLFVLAPAVVIASFASWKTRRHDVRVAVWIYGATAVAMLPRLAINLSVGGVHHLASTRNEFMVTQGYLRIINRDYWQYPVDVSLRKYVSFIPGMASDALGLGVGNFVLIVLLIAAVAATAWRGRLLVVASFAVFALAVAKAQPPPFARYSSPILPGLALLAAVGAVELLRRGWALRIVSVVAIVVIAGAGIFTLPTTVVKYRNAQAGLLHSKAAMILPLINNHRGVLGVRASKLDGIDPSVVAWGTPFLSEADWKTFLLWPNDEEVLAMLAHHHIGWIAILAPYSTEVAYNNIWTEQVYGRRVRAWTEMFKTPNLCKRFHYGFAALFEVGPCPPNQPGLPQSAPLQPVGTR